MKASEFFRAHASSSLKPWEKDAVELARAGLLYPIRWIEFPLQAGTHRALVRVSEDVVSLGEPGDAIRMPLTASAAQAVANLYGALLPTRKLAMDINRAGATRLEPSTIAPNPGPNLASYARHSAAIDQQIAQRGNPPGLVTGGKKDLVVSNRTGSGKEMIYGWYALPGKAVPGVETYADAYGAKFIQPLSDIHDDGYVDYSHGIRLVHGSMNVDGRETPTELVYASPDLSSLVSDEGPLKKDKIRYPAPMAAPRAPETVAEFSRSPLARSYIEGFRDKYAWSKGRG